jgi:hypothetical protein
MNKLKTNNKKQKKIKRNLLGLHRRNVLRLGAVLDGLCGRRRLLLHAPKREDVDDADVVDQLAVGRLESVKLEEKKNSGFLSKTQIK